MKKLMMMSWAFAVMSCGDSTPDNNNNDNSQPKQCGSSSYVEFDAANHAAQDQIVGAFGEMVGLMQAATAEPFSAETAAGNFAQAQALYETTASFRDEVKDLTDDHLAEKPVIGTELDGRITAGLSAGKAATTLLEAQIARQKVEKNLYGFFVGVLYHEFVEGSAEGWDEALGWWGASATNAEAGRRGLAALATERDAEASTTLATTIFRDLVDGSCELAKALKETGKAEITLAERPALQTLVQSIDRQVLELTARAALHEADEIEENLAKLATDASVKAEVWVELNELEPFFHALEPRMIQKGGESKTRAERIRAALDPAMAAADDAWMSTFPIGSIISDLSAEFGISVDG